MSTVLKWALSAGCIAAVVVAGTKLAQSRLDVPGVDAITGKSKSVCVGRFLIDLPIEAVVSMMQPHVDGFDIVKRAETASANTRWLRDREAELGAKLNMLGQKNIESVQSVQGEGYTGRLFMHSRYRTSGIEDGREVFYESVSFEASVHTAGATFVFTSDGDSVSRLPTLISMMRRVQRRSETETPTLPGFCIDGAVISDSGHQNRNENVFMTAALPSHPDLGILFWSNTARIRGAGLIERKAAAIDALTRARTRTLRETKRRINGLDGEEVALRVTELNFATVFGFEWETRGSGHDIFQPQLTLEMQTGLSPRSGTKPVPSSLGEDTVTALWDRISSSVRVRPTSHANASYATPPQLADGRSRADQVRLASQAQSHH